MGLDLLRAARRPSCAGIASLALALALVAWPALRSAAADEDAVKAAFVYRFLRFVRWPEGALGEGPVRLCVLGAPAVGEALEAIRARHAVDGRPLALRRLPAPARASGCHVVFVGAEAEAQLPELLGALGRRPVLTVGDLPGFAGQGGMIGLLQAGGRLRFAIDRGAAERAGLGLSARLLRLATEVRP